MAPIVITLLQGLLLLLLYLFVWRAVRAVVRDVRAAPRQQVPSAPKPARSQQGRGPEPIELVVRQPQEAPRVLPLDGHDITFGRADTSTVMLTDPFVSDAHARVYWADGQWLITDLGSTNGTYVNSQKVVGAQALSPGDQLGIGKTVVEVRGGDGDRRRGRPQR